jgi:2,3-bisphosphoglycerate-independent phosphoglycerate mutase
MRVLFLFLDGVGLGPDDPGVNPLARAAMPALRELLDGRRLVQEAAPLETERATLLSLDACLGVEGAPQSASGQAALLTGRNVPALIGGHYGPKPNRAICAIINEDNLFKQVLGAGKTANFLNAYPPTYFAAIASGHRLYSAIPQAVVSAGLPLHTAEDLYASRALSADFTGEGWRERLGYTDMPLITLRQAGERMARLAGQVDFAFFEYWLSDYAGHRQDMTEACRLLDALDAMLGGLIDAWDDREGVIVLTSDHGNMEDMTVRGHTLNPAPALLIGDPAARRQMAAGLRAASLRALTDVAPAIMRVLLKDYSGL